MNTLLTQPRPGAHNPGHGNTPRRRLSRRALVGCAAAAAVGIPVAAGVAASRSRSSVPSFDGATGWLNSDRLGAADLRDRVVLVNFWTFTCINWLRTAPHVRAWSRAYRDDGLIVIGVHTPEFSFEHDTERVRRAIRDRLLDFPVAIDNDYAIWNSFHNHYWPALYFLDKDGTVADSHFGEGNYEECERVLQRMLGVRRDLVSVRGTGVEADADWRHLQSPESYLGYARSSGFASGAMRDDLTDYAAPAELPLNTWALTGQWTITPEHVRHEGSGGAIDLRFNARDAHLVMSQPIGRHSTPFRVLLDGEAPGVDHGEDIDSNGHGMLREGRLYQLVRAQDTVRQRVLQVSFDTPGAELYSFTFG